MRSAAPTLWSALFKLPEQPALPLQARLRLAVVRAILDGRLPSAAPLPSSRELARLLGLSRNTVTAAYQQLIDEGFLEARPRSGVFVRAGARPVMALPPAGGGASPGTSAPNWSRRVLRSLSQQPTLAKPERWREYPFPFVYGGVDATLFPTDDFRECCSRSLSRAQLEHWTRDFETDDVPELLEQIRLRMLPKRGVFALKDEILVTVGAQQAYFLLAEALMTEATRVGFEEPGYPHARNTFGLRRPVWRPLALDGDGLVTDALQDVDYVFVTPSHQSPTTVTMSLARRQRLLRLAEAQEFVIIEDDYEAENLFDGLPMPALKSLDKAGRVIYVGSLSKSLSPALRLGFIVAPQALIAELRLLRLAMVRHPSPFLQHAYALFLSLGHHDSHARRVNLAMQERLASVSAAMQAHLPGFMFTLPRGGAGIWVQGPEWLDATELAQLARAHGVLIEAGAAFYFAPPYPCRHFRLRLSSIATAAIPAGIRALAAAVDELAHARGERRRAWPAS